MKGALKAFWKRMVRNFKKYKFIYLLMLPGLIQYFVFHYAPLYYLQVAFKKYSVYRGLDASPWVGFKNFHDLFATKYFLQALRNTIILSLMNLFIGFPIPIIIAVLLNELRKKWFSRPVQSIIYLPHFISWVIVGGMFITLLSPQGGIVNTILGYFGIKEIFFMANNDLFRWVVVGAEIWKNCGWGSIIYLASIMSIEPEQYEAARVDGANRLQRMLHITIPSLYPTMLIVLLLNMSKILNIFQPVFTMYNHVVAEVSETIETYVYQIGIIKGDLSFATATGLFKSAVSIVLVLGANMIVKKIRGSSII